MGNVSFTFGGYSDQTWNCVSAVGSGTMQSGVDLFGGSEIAPGGTVASAGRRSFCANSLDLVRSKSCRNPHLLWLDRFLLQTHRDANVVKPK